MNFRSCSYEKEISEALKAGHWPDGCDCELRAHVETCPSCADLVLVAEAFQRARSESAEAAPSGSSELLWWRAQLRSRNAAATKLNRPVTVAQIFAWLVTVLSMAVIVASQYRHGLRWESWWPEFGPSHALHSFLAAASKLDWSLVLLAPSLGMVILLSGVIVYLVTARQ